MPLDVLVAEDSDADALMLEEAVEEAGLPWSLERVEDGAHVLDRLARTPLPALVVLDLALPRVRGEDVLRALHARPRTGRPPVVVVTGSPNPDEEARCLRLGADRFFVKPSRPEGYERLVRALAEALSADLVDETGIRNRPGEGPAETE